MKDAVATMGAVLPDDVGGRDAVHVAVVSAIAGEKLSPGQDVSLIADTFGEGRAAGRGKTIGIVDPFLKADLQPDQRFWLFLYPRTITGLRHLWTHPDFPDGKMAEVFAPPTERLASERWITEWAGSYGVSCQEMIERATDYIERGDYFVRGGEFEGESVPDQFWEHYERVTGKVVKTDDKGSFFSCSC
jgi:hypothetical protein